MKGVTYVSTRDLERSNVSLARLDLLDTRPDLLNDSAKLVTEDVSRAHLQDGTVEEVQVRTADGGACYLEDDIVVLDDFGLGDGFYPVDRLTRRTGGENGVQ